MISLKKLTKSFADDLQFLTSVLVLHPGRKSALEKKHNEFQELSV